MDFCANVISLTPPGRENTFPQFRSLLRPVGGCPGSRRLRLQVDLPLRPCPRSTPPPFSGSSSHLSILFFKRAALRTRSNSNSLRLVHGRWDARRVMIFLLFLPSSCSFVFAVVACVVFRDRTLPVGAEPPRMAHRGSQRTSLGFRGLASEPFLAYTSSRLSFFFAAVGRAVATPPLRWAAATKPSRNSVSLVVSVEERSVDSSPNSSLSDPCVGKTLC